MKPKYALVIAEKPAASEDGIVIDPSLREKWRVLATRVQDTLKQVPEHQRLTEGVWLLYLAHGLSDFLAVSWAIEDRGFPFRILFFEEDLPWIAGGATPK